MPAPPTHQQQASIHGGPGGIGAGFGSPVGAGGMGSYNGSSGGWNPGGGVGGPGAGSPLGGMGSYNGSSGSGIGAGFGSPAGASGNFGSLNGGYGGPGGGWGKSTIEGLHKMNSEDRQLVNQIAGALQKNYSMSLPDAIVSGSQIAKTVYGELGLKWGTPKNAAAVARTIVNRLGLAKTKGAYGGTVGGVLKGFDASGYDQPRVSGAGIPPHGNAAFQSAMPGTPGYQTGLDALQGQLLGTGPSLPPGVANATNYRAGSMGPPNSAGAPSWEHGKATTSYGPHTFSNPDPGRPASMVAANNQQITALGGPSGTAMAGPGAGLGANAMGSLSMPGASASLGQGVAPGSAASASATPSYPDAQQGSWLGNLGAALGSGLDIAKAYGADYLTKVKSPENIAAFAKQNPMGAMKLAGAFGSLSPGAFGSGGANNSFRTSDDIAKNQQLAAQWFQSNDKERDKPKKKQGGKKPAQQPPRWVFPSLLARPYTLIS